MNNMAIGDYTVRFEDVTVGISVDKETVGQRVKEIQEKGRLDDRLDRAGGMEELRKEIADSIAQRRLTDAVSEMHGLPIETTVGKTVYEGVR